MGDKKIEADLRRQMRSGATTMADLQQADDKLIKLWRQGERDFKTLRRRLGIKNIIR